jgi:hypothetical protein
MWISHAGSGTSDCLGTSRRSAIMPWMLPGPCPARGRRGILRGHRRSGPAAVRVALWCNVRLHSRSIPLTTSLEISVRKVTVR